MGSVHVGDEAGPSQCRKDEEYMEDAHGTYYVPDPCPHSMLQSSLQSSAPWPYLTPLNFTPKVYVIPLQRLEVEQHETMISTAITWRHEGHQVAIEGSWDNWNRREYLQRSDGELMIMKMLPVGIYHYLFFVDGHRTCAPDLPQESDDKGDIFNVLNLQRFYCSMEREDNTSESESSPLSSYNNEHLSFEAQKVPELPPFLENTHLKQHQFLDEPQSMEKPLPCVLNHLFIAKPSTREFSAALGSMVQLNDFAESI